MKTKIFSYYLQKLAEEEQKLLGVNDERAALFALVLTKADLFRRLCTGSCTTQKLYFCEPRFVHELFVYICLEAKENGRNLLSLFNVSQTLMHGRLYLEDKDITRFLDEVFPKVRREEEIEKTLYAVLLPEIAKHSEADGMWIEKFAHPSNLRNVNLDVLCPVETGEETALVDAVLAELKDDEVFRGMLSRGNRCNIYGQSIAYHAYLPQIEDFPKGY